MDDVPSVAARTTDCGVADRDTADVGDMADRAAVAPRDDVDGIADRDTVVAARDAVDVAAAADRDDVPRVDVGVVADRVDTTPPALDARDVVADDAVAALTTVAVVAARD